MSGFVNGAVESGGGVRSYICVFGGLIDDSILFIFQPHLRKCFDAMASADFENGPPLEGDTAPTIQLTGMNSAEKEKVSALDYNLFKVISYI